MAASRGKGVLDLAAEPITARENLADDLVRAVSDFIRRHYGARPFWYTPSNGEPQKWTCKKFNDKRGEGGLRTVTATFRQSFNLVT